MKLYYYSFHSTTYGDYFYFTKQGTLKVFRYYPRGERIIIELSNSPEVEIYVETFPIKTEYIWANKEYYTYISWQNAIQDNTTREVSAESFLTDSNPFFRDFIKQYLIDFKN